MVYLFTTVLIGETQVVIFLLTKRIILGLDDFYFSYTGIYSSYFLLLLISTTSSILLFSTLRIAPNLDKEQFDFTAVIRVD